MKVTAGATDRDVEHERERQVEERRPAHGARLAPVEPRMSQQDRHPAQHEHQEAQRGRPVRHANEGGMAGKVKAGFTLHGELGGH